jgi:L-lactate utilization protein LutC
MAFCINCGSTKNHYSDKCASCSFTPQSSIDMAKSMLLCKEYNWEGVGLPYGEADIELKIEQIKSGNVDVFDSDDVEQALKFQQSEGGLSDKLYAIAWGIGFFALVIVSILYIAGIISF